VSEAVITVKGLRMVYGDLEAVRGIDLHVDEGEIFALLGPNGAGKTTTTEILEGYRTRTAGEVSVLGFDPVKRDRSMRAEIGIVLQSTGVDPYLTVEETVELYRSYYPSPRPRDEVIDLVGLREKAKEKVSKLSGGQQRRLDVAIALAGDPKLFFLDEPTTGFDPNARRNAWEIVKNLTSIGKTVFLTTHFMDEAQYLANRVAVISKGAIVAEGPPSTIGGRDTAQTVIRFRVADGGGLPNLGEVAAEADGTLILRTDEPTRALQKLTTWAVERGVVLDGLEVSRPTLEDIYLELTGKEEVTAE
jgi:ABC-2 type transport system ATP-binding protein